MRPGLSEAIPAELSAEAANEVSASAPRNLLLAGGFEAAFGPEGAKRGESSEHSETAHNLDA